MIADVWPKDKLGPVIEQARAEEYEEETPSDSDREE